MAARITLYKDGQEWEGWASDAKELRSQGWTEAKEEPKKKPGRPAKDK